jgi:hypothetical protein
MNETSIVIKPKTSTKNECAKMRDKKNPYEVWRAGSWTWKVLKKYQSPEKEAANPYARWFCFVTSPYCPNGELGDVYVREIKQWQKVY